jgi:hypothetical protein
MCENISVNIPGFKYPVWLKIKTYKIIREIPVTISGFIIGKFVIFKIMLLTVFLEFNIPNAAIVPKTIAADDAIIATKIVFHNAVKIILF